MKHPEWIAARCRALDPTFFAMNVNRVRFLALLVSTLLVSLPRGHTHETDGESAQRILVAATNFLASLSPAQRQQAVFPLNDPERKDWSNLPHAMHPRKGVCLGDLSAAQRVQAHRLIQAGLSSQGYLKASGIMQLDEVLLHLSGQDKAEKPMFGIRYYWLSFLGEPSARDPWGWQLDGHHLALNFALAGKSVDFTPTFMGADPHEVRDGPHAGWRILGAEDDKGLALMKSLTPEQQRQALLGTNAPADVITGPGRDKALQRFEGLRYGALNAHQKALLVALVEEYVSNYRPDLADAHRERIRRAGWENVWFAWAGPQDPSAPYYYRIHGPTMLIEFDNNRPPGRSEGPANHIHSVFRDPEHDYGEDWLKKHYEESHRPKP